MTGERAEAPWHADIDPGPRPLVIDTHAHVWPHGLVHGSQWTQHPLAAEPADLIRAADRASVATVVILAASVHEDNDFVFTAAGASSGRLAAVAVIDPWRPEAIAALRSSAAAGAVGIRIAPRTLGAKFAEERGPLADVIDCAAELDLVIQWTVTLKATEPIEFAAVRQPALAQVLDHMGLPEDPADTASLMKIRELAAIPELRIKLSGFYALSHVGYPYTDTWSWAEGVVAAFGPSRTLWASDWPLSTESAPYREQWRLVTRLPFLDETGRAAVLAGTASGLFGLGQLRLLDG